MVTIAPSDIDLLDDARAGDTGAFAELYRRHRSAALRVAHGYGAGDEAEDIVNTAFERVMAAMRRGSGPVDAFRPYLFVTIRRLTMERSGRAEHELLDDVPEAVVAVSDLPELDASDRAMVSEAFSHLPDRWQSVLWQIAVEGRQPKEVARTTGLPANTVSVLAHRARERLRQTYLQAHIRTADPERCRPHRARLGAYVRGGLSRRQRAAADAHLERCETCGQLVAELDDVNRLLARAVLPVFALGADPGLALGAGAGIGAGAGGAAAGGTTAPAGAAAISAGSVGASAGAGAGLVAKVGLVVAAVVGGAVALAPRDASPRDGRPTVEAVGPAGIGERADSAQRRAGDVGATTTPRGAETPRVDGDDETDGSAVQEAPPPGDAEPPNPGLGVAPQVGAEVDVSVGVAGTDIGIGADVEVGLTNGITVNGAWTVSPLGTGTLAIRVANPGSSALVDAEVVVDLSPGAAPTTLLGTGCESPDSGLIDVVVGLLRSLTCGLDDVAAQGGVSVALPLAVVGRDQSATIRVVDGQTVLASVVVPLAPRP